ncbi:MAG: SDR family oxidoreductase [Paracoccaceae bacterium]|nr:SDR family oxidoreductase [Paracoccaceae bacterium]
MERFDGKTAAITGGASGIGLAIASRMLSEGANVAIWDLNEAPEGVLPQDRLLQQRVDITDYANVCDARDGVVNRFGGLDILICSAGITGPNTTVADYPIDAWRSVIEVNLHGLFHCNKAVVETMTDAGYGRIVNIASVAGKEGNPNASAYSTSKAGVIGLTKSLGKELAKTGVLVNCIAPAAVATPIFDQMSKEFIDFMLTKIPMGRFGEIDEIASLVCWLASEECSFSTGAVYDISGGRATY